MYVRNAADENPVRNRVALCLLNPTKQQQPHSHLPLRSSTAVARRLKPSQATAM